MSRAATSAARLAALSLAGAIALAGGAPPALASPHSEVASAFDAEDRFDLHVSLEYGLELHRAGIRREQSGLPGTQPTDPVPVVKDLFFEGSRHLIMPRLELGLFTDLALTAALPVVISDGRTLLLDQRDTPCVFPGGSQPATCIDRTNSSTIADNILPANGFDAEDPGGPGFANGATIFRGPARAGLDQVHVGLVWAPMNQDRDDTKPTWKIGAEGRLAIGAPMRLNPQNPGSEASVGRGVHEVYAWTSFARRLRWAEPFMKIWWLAPVLEVEDSAFRPLGFGQDRSAAQQRAGVDFGIELPIWGQRGAQRVVADAGARIQGNFEGRAYTEMWEVFQYAGTPGRGGPLVLDASPDQEGRQDLAHPGVTTVENHLQMGGDLGVRVELGKLQVGLSFALMYTQPHAIAFSDAGQDLPTCGAGVSGPCENDDNAIVNSGTAEVNPGYVTLIDLVGQRYRVDEVLDYAVAIEARMLF
jgi:hypothetical protein